MAKEAIQAPRLGAIKPFRAMRVMLFTELAVIAATAQELHAEAKQHVRADRRPAGLEADKQRVGLCGR